MTRRITAIAVASFRSPSLLEACLDAIDQLPERKQGLEVVVGRRGDLDPVIPVVAGRPGVRLVPAGDGANVPRLRGVALQAAAGAGWVALTEDHCLVARDWIQELERAIGGDTEVVGGGMGNAQSGPTEWAAYFSEYGFFASTRATAAGAAPSLTGANVAYGPRVRGRVAEWASGGVWENVIHERLAGEGVRMRFAPRARVLQNALYRFLPFCRDRYDHGVDYARDRLAQSGGAGRWLRLASVPVLPFLLTLRVARAAAREDASSFVRALPTTFAFLAAWSVGEGIGYLRGSSR